MYIIYVFISFQFYLTKQYKTNYTIRIMDQIIFGLANNVQIASEEFIQRNINNILRMPLVYSLKQEGIETIRRHCYIPEHWTIPEMIIWFNRFDTIMMHLHNNRRELVPYIIDYQRGQEQGHNFRILQLPIECLTDNARRWLLTHVVVFQNDNHFEHFVYNYYQNGMNNNVRRDVFYVVLPIYNGENQG